MNTQFHNEEVSRVPPGFSVKTVRHSSGHQVRIAFPPGKIQTGAGRVISILHPETEKNPRSCAFSPRVRRNPDFITPLVAGIAAGATAAVGQTLAQRFVINGRKVRNAGNGDAAAEAAFTAFHGRGPKKLLELDEALVKSGSYFTCGQMGSVWLYPLEMGLKPSQWPEASIAFAPREGVKLTSEPGGRQAFFMGAPQDLDRDVDGALPAGSMIELGTVYGIGYIAQKRFDGFKTSMYCHQFAEEGGTRPMLWYSRQHQKMLLVGGTYFIDPVSKEFGMSRGIRD